MPIVLAGLALVLVAALGMLLIHGQQQFTRSVAGLMPSWHIPGLGSIRDWVNAAGNAFATQLVGVFGYALTPLAHLIQVPVRWLMKHLTGWLAAGVAVLNVLTYLRTALIPWVLNHLSTALSAVESRLLSLLAAARAQLTALISYVQAHLVALISAVETAVLSALAAARAELVALISYVQAHLVAYIAASIAAVRTELAITKAWLIAYCDAKVAQVVAAAVANEHVLLGRALAATWPRALDEIDAVIATADKDFADALANLRGLRGISLANPFAVLGALAGVLTGLLRFTRDCTIPNCRNLSQVGRDIQELFGVVEGEALIGLLAAAYRDPAAVGRGALDVAAPIIQGAADGVRGQVAA